MELHWEGSVPAASPTEKKCRYLKGAQHCYVFFWSGKLILDGLGNAPTINRPTQLMHLHNWIWRLMILRSMKLWPTNNRDLTEVKADLHF